MSYINIVIQQLRLNSINTDFLKRASDAPSNFMIASKTSGCLETGAIRDVRLGLVAKDWTFDKFDSEEYARIREISRQTGRFGILSAFLSARRRHLAQLEASQQLSPHSQEEKPSSNQQDISKQPKPPSQQIEPSLSHTSPTSSNYPKPKIEEQFSEPCFQGETLVKESTQSQTNQKYTDDQKEKSSQKIKDQRDNIKRWKLEKAKARKIFTTYKPQTDEIKLKNEPTKNPHAITKSNIASLYEVTYFAELNEKIYVQGTDQDPFFLEVYKYVHHLVKVDLLYPPQEVNLSKIRTFVVRKILDDFVSEQSEGLTEMEKAHLCQIKKRMTKRDKENYQKAGISIPKSRIQNSYLIEIFKKKDFGRYYKQYLSSSRLSTFLKENNQQQISKFQSNINRIHCCDLDLQEKLKIFKKISKRPVVMANISQYESEAKLVLLEYFHE